MSSLRLKEKSDVHGPTFRLDQLKPFLTPYVFVRIEVDSVSGCWIYTGARSKSGYSSIWYGGKVWPGHKLSYTLLVGPVPDGYELDHKCHDPQACSYRDSRCIHRACINPGDVQPLTHGENQRRGGKSYDLRQLDVCINGHPYTPRNTYIAKNGTRACNTCRAIATRNSYLKTHPHAKAKSDIGWWTADA
jgi:hypothetical protein